MSEDFYEFKSVKKSLEEKLNTMFVVNEGCNISIRCYEIETIVQIKEIFDSDNKPIPYGITKDCDVEVDILEIPGYHERKGKEKEEEQRMFEEFAQKKAEEEEIKQKQLDEIEYEKRFSKVKTKTHKKMFIHKGEIVYVSR